MWTHTSPSQSRPWQRGQDQRQVRGLLPLFLRIQLLATIFFLGIQMLATIFVLRIQMLATVFFLTYQMLATIYFAENPHVGNYFFPDISDVGKSWKNILSDTSNIFEDEFEATCWTLFSLPIVLPPTWWSSFDNDNHDVGSAWESWKVGILCWTNVPKTIYCENPPLWLSNSSFTEEMIMQVSICAAKDKSCARSM